MGYYTRYELDIVDGPTTETNTDACEHCGRSGDNVRAILGVLKTEDESVAYVFGGDTSKWYDHEDDMKKHSKRWPTSVFRLQGWGEEEGDIWVKFFKDGKMQLSKATIKLDEFDAGALK